MFEMSQEELQGVVQQPDQAIYNHEQWHKDLTRTLICRLPHDQRDVQRDAHRHCRFGQWYYTRAEEHLHGITAAHNAGKPIGITVSFGIALLDPEIAVEETIDRADKAMYAAKAAGRNCTPIWDPSM